MSTHNFYMGASVARLFSQLFAGVGTYYAISRDKPLQVPLALIFPNVYAGYHVAKNYPVWAPHLSQLVCLPAFGGHCKLPTEGGPLRMPTEGGPLRMPSAAGQPLSSHPTKPNSEVQPSPTGWSASEFPQ